MTGLMQRVTWLGTAWFELPFVLLVVAILWRRYRMGDGIRYFLWGLGGWAAYAVLKMVFHRSRPSGIPRLSGAGWHSFPSGHAMLAPILFVFAASLLTAEPGLRRFRVPALVLAWLVSFLLAFSRVYLGVHYPSDVVAGLVAGSAWLALSLAFTGSDRPLR
ncbi:MAG: phosphatase PAP2 family protein [Gemmatimonadota bacterium]